ncbi:MAG: putative secretion protein [Moraxellaceae bacterium]|jgi:type IV pilus assembly protein PilE|nr:putative secretion protein [Moraxellaceae bacterium]
MKKQQGFTLMELMIAVALVAILTMMAVPAYVGYGERSARASVQADLATAASALERRKAQNFTYAGATAGSGPTDTFSNRSPSDAAPGEQKYNIILTLLTSDGSPVAAVTDVAVGYEVTAVSTNTFATGKSEALKINHMGQKCYKPLGAGVTDCVFGTDKPWP